MIWAQKEGPNVCGYRHQGPIAMKTTVSIPDSAGFCKGVLVCG